VLRAADIIIQRATKVPVGKDQEQHLEMARILPSVLITDTVTGRNSA
jgi:tryptophanyl-tRNA synthetase